MADKIIEKSRKPIASVVGSARSGSPGESEAEILGRILVDNGFRIVTGGLGGIMEATSRGARSSVHYTPGDVIGILPTYDSDKANNYVDIPICTGLQHARNLIVAATGDILFAVGGRSGTLSEISLAWTLGKLIICINGGFGWADELTGKPLDDRRQDKIYGPFDPEEAVAFAKQQLPNHQNRSREF